MSAEQSRTIAIGDVHGCGRALAALIEAVDPQPADTVITLGDYVNRGPDTKGVLDQLIALPSRCQLIPLLGNHEVMMMRARDNPRAHAKWLASGGAATLDSYGGARSIGQIPAAHWAFIAGAKKLHETANHFFVHGNYEPHVPLAQQIPKITLWLSLRDSVPVAHQSGKTAIVGHTPQADGQILDLGYLKCIDTGCCRGGWLTALEVQSGQIWQSNEQGEVRESG